MKLFEMHEKYFAIVGIDSYQATRKIPINGKNSATLLILISALMSTNAFIWFEADTFPEYAESFYVAATSIICFGNFVILFTRMSKFFEFIENLEHLVQTSKWKLSMKNYYLI